MEGGCKNRMKFHQFCLRLSEQMLTYDPSLKCYPGDQTFRRWTQKPKSRRSLEEEENTYSKDGVTLENFKLAIENGWLCSMIGDMH
jgi:hypothetical protein